MDQHERRLPFRKSFEDLKILHFLHKIRLLCQFYNTVDVTYLEPYYPSQEEQSNAGLYAENVRKLMVKLSNFILVLLIFYLGF